MAIRTKGPFAIGVDYGTSGTRAMLFDTRGRLIAQAKRPSPVISRDGGLLEQDMTVSALGGLAAVKEVMQSSGVKPSQISGMAASGWMHGDVPLDKNGSPLANASMWNCPRSVAEYEEIMADQIMVDTFRRLTGNEPAVRWTIVKALHMMRSDPQLFERTANILTPKDYWNFFLTGKLAQECSDMIGAVNTGGDYAHELFEMLEMPNKFASLVDPTERVGRLTLAAAKEMMLPEGLPVFAGGGDQQCGRIGMGVVRPGTLGFNLGTSGVTTAFNPKGVQDPKGEIHFFGDWLMACCMSSGGSLDWMKNVLSYEREGTFEFETMMTEAGTVKPGSEGVRFLPFLSGGNHPVRDPNAKGAFLGLTLKTGMPEMTRAVMEAVAIEMVLCAKKMQGFGIDANEIFLAGGGARDKTGTWPQIFADAMGKPVTLNMVEDASALGAAIIAFVGAGVFKDYKEACAAMVRRGRTFEPTADNAGVYEKVAADYIAGHEALKAMFK